MIFEVCGFGDQRIAFPVSDGVSKKGRLGGRRVLAAVEVDGAFGVHPIDLHDDAVLLNGDHVGHGVEHQSRRADRNAVLLRRGLRINDAHRRLAFVGDLPASRPAKETVEFRARREPGSRKALGHFILAGIDATRSNVQREIGAVLLVQVFSQKRSVGVVSAWISADGDNVADSDRIFREAQGAQHGRGAGFDFHVGRRSVGFFHLQRHVHMRIPEPVFRDSAGDLHFLLRVVRGSAVVRQGRNGKAHRHRTGQNKFRDPIHNLSSMFGREVIILYAMLRSVVLLTLFVAACSVQQQPSNTPAKPDSSPGAPYKKLELTSDKRVVGAEVRVAATDLPAGKTVELQWGTVEGGWVIEDYYHFKGKKYKETTTSLGQFKTDSIGRLDARFAIPEDYGGVHEVTALIDGKPVAQNGIEVTQSFEISPDSGPIGTPIELKVKGLGWRTMESTWVVNWDNRAVGFVSAAGTRGSAVARFRAVGPIGDHPVKVYSGYQAQSYLNYEQAPNAYLPRPEFTFRTTAGQSATPSAYIEPYAPQPVPKTEVQIANAKLDSQSDSRTGRDARCSEWRGLRRCRDRFNSCGRPSWAVESAGTDSNRVKT